MATRLDIRSWLLGLWAAIISGGASAIVAGITVNVIDPKDFNFSMGNFWHLIGTLFVVNGVLTAAAYLKQSPVPHETQDEQ